MTVGNVIDNQVVRIKEGIDREGRTVDERVGHKQAIWSKNGKNREGEYGPRQNGYSSCLQD